MTYSRQLVFCCQNKMTACGFTHCLVFFVFFPGRTLLQILTVPPEKGANIKSSTGTLDLIIYYYLLIVYT